MFQNLIGFFGFLFNIIILGSVTLCFLIFLLFSYYNTNLPSSEEIENYKPATLSRVYDKDGAILGIFGQKSRIYTSIDDIPSLVKHAFISAEDKNFYRHSGYDPIGLLKAISDAFRGKKLRGASTITQQVMKNFLLSSERTGKRKIKEIILASKIEKVLSKDQILSVYLNEIYLGQGAYGVTAAAITYFDKKLHELNIAEAAFLAALPKAPSFYHPIRQREKSIQRRNFVIKELNENGFISAIEAEEATALGLQTIVGATSHKKDMSLKENSSYFTDAIQKSILSKYSKEALETDGLTIRSTLSPHLQKIAKSALQSELIKFDQSLGIFRGPLRTLKKIDFSSEEKIQAILSSLKQDIPVDGWFVALVQNISINSIELEIFYENDKLKSGKLYLDENKWAKKRLSVTNKITAVDTANELFTIGDIIFVSREKSQENPEGYWALRQVPKIQGAFMVMEPNSGKVLAMQGGFSYQFSNFNRALQANRQPGSLFKPFVYLAALENGFRPNSIIVDAPISVEQVSGVWRPENASDDWFGVAPLRKGLEYSRNLMTVRLAKVVGMSEVKKYAELFGLYSDMPTFLSYSLGAGETSLFRLMTAYSIFANGGFEVEPSFFDLVQDRFGKTIYKHGYLKCLGCKNVATENVRKPIFLNMAKRLVDPISVFQVNSMLQGVVERGTASKTVGRLGKSIAGKTGTTNNAKDVWFIGFTPTIVAGCYMGYDIPKSLGINASGGAICGNAFKTFMDTAFGDDFSINWKVPEGTKVLSVDYDTGEFVDQNKKRAIKEIFRIEESHLNKKRAEVIDGFGMGQDLLFLNERINSDELNKPFLKRSLGAIKTGEEY